jgi:hypothetical protein
MNDFRIEIDIQAPPDRVWAIMRDVDRWPEWTPTVRKIRRLDAGPIAVGMRGIVYQPKLPPAKWTITELDDTRRTFTWINRSPGLLITACHGVQATGAGSSRAMLSLRFTGLFAGLMARITRDLNNRYLDLEARGLKRASEASDRPA